MIGISFSSPGGGTGNCEISQCLLLMGLDETLAQKFCAYKFKQRSYEWNEGKADGFLRGRGIRDENRRGCMKLRMTMYEL